MVAIAAIAAITSIGASAVTAPGVTISNIAYFTYTTPGLPSAHTMGSTIASFQVAELVDARVSWRDLSPQVVSSPDTLKPTTFQVINTGNGTHRFVLTAESVAGPDFTATPSATPLYLESGAQSGLQLIGPNADIPLGNDSPVDFLAQESKTVYALADIPSGLALGKNGTMRLKASSIINAVRNAPMGTILVGQGTAGVDLLVGPFAGTAKDSGQYTAQGAIVTTEKTVVGVLDIAGGAKVAQGSILTYQIRIQAQGVGVLNDLLITDSLPAEMDYVPNSMTVNGVSITDSGHLNGNIVSIPMGTQTSPYTGAVQFQARIR